MANRKKDVKDSRVTFTINPDIEKQFREKVKADGKTFSGVITSLIQAWLSGSPAPMGDALICDDTNYFHQKRLDELEAALRDVKEELSTLKGMRREPVKPIQSEPSHTNSYQYEAIPEGLGSPDIEVPCIVAPPVRPSHSVATTEGRITTAEAVSIWLGREPVDKTEYNRYAKRIATYIKKLQLPGEKIGRDNYYPKEEILQYIRDNPIQEEIAEINPISE